MTKMNRVKPVQIFSTLFMTSPRLSAIPPDISQPCEDLREILLQAPDVADAVYESLFDLLEFGKQHPQGLDSALRIWNEALAPVNGNGFPVDARRTLARFIADHANLFQGGPEQLDVGKEISWDTFDKATGDACNILFTRREVDEKLAKVIERTRDFQDSRREIIVLQAIRGRSQATGIANASADAIEWIDFSLDPFREPSPPWSKADFIACCILLRSCAKSLIDGLPADVGVSKLSDWKQKYSAFVHTETLPKQRGPLNRDNDFVVKLHAVYVLDNLDHGPRDESSEELFSPAKWIF